MTTGVLLLHGSSGRARAARRSAGGDGRSWGAEAALLLGALDQRVDAVVAFAPSAFVWGRFVEDGLQRSAWTWQGEP